MQIKRFEAETISRALRAVKAELGPDAVILETRKLTGTGRAGVQVTAAFEPAGTAAKRPPLVALPAEKPSGVVDPPWAKGLTPRGTVARKPETALSPSPAQGVTLEAVESAIVPLRQDLNAFGDRMKHLIGPQQEELHTVQQEVSHLRALVNDLVVDRRVEGLPDDMRPVYLSLTSKGLPRELAADIVSHLPDDQPERLVEAIADRIPIAGPLLSEGGPHHVLFVGPTGVGKTTTIAKLAAHYRVNEGRNVALVTLDTFRIGAVEQLSTYARIIGVPCSVANDRDELMARLKEHQDADLILIDTAGRSPKDPDHVRGLVDIGLENASVQLVVPATHSPADLATIVEAYRPLAPAGMILTKLDEAERLGGALNTALDASIPLSYLTNGQRIPEDLHLASGARLATQFLS